MHTHQILGYNSFNHTIINQLLSIAGLYFYGADTKEKNHFSPATVIYKPSIFLLSPCL